MAAHAVDVTLSGHVNRALFITDSDDASSTSGTVKDNGSSGTRIRVKGTGEMMDGGSAGVLLEYGAGSIPAPGKERNDLSLRYADVWFSGDYGKVSIGHGDQGGEGSVYKGGAAVLGTGHGQDHNGVAKGYYTSLDGGAGRNERIRYDSPSVGPVSAAISVGNGDQVSAGISLSQEFGGTSFNAGVGTIQWGGSDKSTISGSAGVSLASGISISGAWGRGSDYMGALDMGKADELEVPAIPAHFRSVNIVDDTYMLDSNPTADGVESGTFDTHMDRLRTQILAATPETGVADQPTKDRAEVAKKLKRQLFMMAGAGTMDMGCNPAEDPDQPLGGAQTTGTPMCGDRMYPETAAVAAVPGTDDTQHVTDPSFFQVAVAYAFGDTSVGVSWYQSSDMQREGSELTAIGAGVDHNLPKLGTNVYAAVQNYSIEDGSYKDTDDTVIMIGARVKF